MPTSWLDPVTFKSKWEKVKDKTYKSELKTHGQLVVFSYPVGGHAQENIFAYFDREHEEGSIDAEVVYSSRDPMVECRYADFTNVPQVKDEVRIIQQFGDLAIDPVYLDLNFEITDRHEPDEQGAMIFKLRLIDATRTNTAP